MNEHLLIGTRKGLAVFTKTNGAWSFKAMHLPGVPVSYAMADSRNGTWWACLDHGHWGQKLSRSRDQGATWEDVTSPKYPEDATILGNDAAFEEMSNPESKPKRVEIPATLKLQWTLVEGGHDRPGTLYMGTEPGGLFVTRDDGDTWELVRGLWDHPSRLTQWFGGGRDNAGIHSILVDPQDSDHIFVGISCAGVFETRDGGDNWEPRNKGLNATFLPDPSVDVGHDAHCLHWSPADTSVIWQQNHCGVYVSRDGAANWQDVSQKDGPVNFGFPIVTDPDNPARAWVVPANSDGDRSAHEQHVKVARTDDHGATWTVLTEGLPRPAWDLVYRHALDISQSTLAFGSTTGSLYLSENGGDNWQELSAHLPPVYSVRFG